MAKTRAEAVLTGDWLMVSYDDGHSDYEDYYLAKRGRDGELYLGTDSGVFRYQRIVDEAEAVAHAIREWRDHKFRE